jgi:sugar phosphate isomerase/epimerase
MPYLLSAFADEISPDIQIEMDHLQDNGLSWCAMRGANGKNVMEFEDFQIKLMKQQFHNRKFKFSCIGSPVGKVLVTESFENEVTRFRRAITIARGFETKVVRIFSFYIPKDEAPEKHKDEVFRRMNELANIAKQEGINLLVENEKGLYGDTGPRHAEVIAAVGQPHVKAAFDFSNFVQIGDDPWAAWQLCKKYVVDIHVKDFSKALGRECPAGEGDGRVKDILRDAFASGWKGFLTFEPHLSESHEFKGFTGPKLFKVAVDALKGVLQEVGAK